ncbi:hypothetical protein [Dactylosporangium sp. NPDC048998]|uniref:hypothetical protein n=1 Tax=Dactylosporangium sp. NPDC048998 TaxID=3363976 RepID=UPI0037147DCC
MRNLAGDARLAALEQAGLVRRGRLVAEVGAEGALPVVHELRAVLPGGLRRGGTVAVASSGVASTSLLLLLLAAASRAGAWCGVVGLPSLNPFVADETGIRLDRLALLPDVGAEWTSAVVALLDGLDVVAVATSDVPSAALCGRLAARARQRGSVLMPFGGWSQADVTLHAEGGVWEGLGRGRGRGRGRVQCREVSVVARGRGSAARPRRATLWLPRPTGLYAQRARSAPVAEPSPRLMIVPARPAGASAPPTGASVDADAAVRPAVAS